MALPVPADPLEELILTFNSATVGWESGVVVNAPRVWTVASAPAVEHIEQMLARIGREIDAAGVPKHLMEDK